MNLDEPLDIDAILQRAGRRSLLRGSVRLFLLPMLYAYFGRGTGFPTYWIYVFFALVSIGRGLAVFGNYVLDRLMPETRGAFLWPEIGKPTEVRKSIEDDWNLSPATDKYRLGISYLTPSWLLRWNDAAWSEKVAFQAIPLRYAALAYGYRQPVTNKAMVAIHWSGKTSATEIAVPTLEAGAALLAQMQKRAPWAYFGLSEENYLGWTTNHEAVVEAAHKRYDQVQSGEAVVLSPLTPDDAVECFELPLKPLKATETMIPERMDITAVVRSTTLAMFGAVGIYLFAIPLICWIVAAWVGHWLPFITPLAVIVGVLSALFGALGAWSETMDLLHPEQRGELRFPALGDAAAVRQMLEVDWNESPTRDKLRFGDFYLTPSWLMEWSANSFRPRPLRYVAWAYVSEERKGLKGRSQPTIVVHWSSGRGELTIPLNSKVDAVEFLAALRQRAPWAYIGDTRANRRRWSEDQELFVQTVISRWELVQAGKGFTMPAEWDENTEGWIEDE